MRIFVFGSNLAGKHLAGAALHAVQHYGAEEGIGVGLTGRAYALPTKNYNLETLPLDNIKAAVTEFLFYVLDHPDDVFLVTRIGCGIAGYTDTDIAPIFHGFYSFNVSNVHLPVEWLDLYWCWKA